VKNRETLLRSRWIRPFAHLFTHPSLWHLNRRSVPRALAVGLFAAFVLPVGQFALAALLAVPLRANVPLAAAATLVTNPLTFPPIYIGAYKLGTFLLNHAPHEGADDLAKSFGATVLEVSGPTALGLLVFAMVSSIVGFAAASLWWRYRLIRRRRMRDAISR
jgi:uncharacterized protein